MTKRIVLTLIIFLLTSISLKLHTQEVNNNASQVPLAKVLSELEQVFDVRFSYADAMVSTLSIAPLDSLDDLDKALRLLEIATGLSFKSLDNRFITISNPNSVGNIQELDPIYIANLLTAGISKSNSGITLIKPEQFGILPGIIEPDVLQTVQALPGILSVDETVSNLNIRGGTNDQNLILWDGIKMYQSGHFFGLISAFNPYLTRRVEIIKNGTSAQYGDGVSGTINIEIDDRLGDSLQGSVSANLLHVKAYAKVPFSKKITLLASARRSTTDFIITPTYDSFTERIFQDTDLRSNAQRVSTASDINFFFYDASVKVLFDISPKDKLRVSATTIFNKLSYLEASTQESGLTQSGITQGNDGVQLTYSRRWSPSTITTLEGYGSNYNLVSSDFDIDNNQQLDQENQVLDIGLKLQTTVKLNDQLRLAAGYQFFEVGARNLAQTNNPTFFRNERNVVTTHALFTEASVNSKNSSSQITAGVRANYIPTLGELIIEPRLRFSQRFFNYFKLEAMGEFKSQSIFQIIDQPNDFLGLESRRWVSSNGEDAPVIKSRQASASISFTKDKWLLSAEGFIKEVNGITSRSQGFQNQFQFTNEIGRYNILGIDFLLSKRFRRFGSWLSYSFSDNRYLFDAFNDGLPFANNTNVRHFLTVGSSYTLQRFKFAAGLNWRTGTPITRPDLDASSTSGDIIYQNPNSALSDNFLRVDISAIYSFELLHHEAQLGASIWNVLNNDNIINTFYTRDVEGEIIDIEQESLRLTPNLSFQWSF